MRILTLVTLLALGLLSGCAAGDPETTEQPDDTDMQDYGNMKKTGSLGMSSPTNEVQITTEPGDLILCRGSAFVVYYAPDSWSFARLGRIDGITQTELKEALGTGDVSVTLSLDQSGTKHGVRPRPTKERGHMKIGKAEDRSTMQGPDAWFTGGVTLEMLFTAEEPGRMSAARVTFEPGARTFWHSHPYGQALVVTDGHGLVQEWGGAVREIVPGDVVWFAAGEKHWHGAAPDGPMSHLAIQEAQEGEAVEWMEKVSDEQYGAQ